jgi:hypothetical protein
MTRPHLFSYPFHSRDERLDGLVDRLRRRARHRVEEPDVAPWSKTFGSEGSNPQVTAITTGVSGNIALTGAFYGAINFGAGDLEATAQPSFYVAKLTAGGEHVWSGRTGGGNDTATSLALDRGGSTLLTGFFDGDLDLGTGLLSGDDDLFLARYGASGEPVWSRKVGTQFVYDAARDIAVSLGDGSIHLTGRAGGLADFGLGPISEAQWSTLFVAKLNASGTAIWNRAFGIDGYADGRKLSSIKMAIRSWWASSRGPSTWAAGRSGASTATGSSW